MAIKMAMGLAPANVSDTGYAIADARHIGGHRVVASLNELYTLSDWKLLGVDETDTDMALGQQWYVKGVGSYRLINWGSRKSSAGWVKVVDPNNIDTTLFEVVSVLPTTNIKSNRIYLVSASNTDPSGGNKYYEYIYTGVIGGTYDATKWEKLGEYKAEYKPEVATSSKLGCVKSTVYTAGKLDVAKPNIAPVTVNPDGTMNTTIIAARSGAKGVVGVDHAESETDEGYEVALKTDSEGNGYVSIGTITLDEINDMFANL